MILHKVSVRIEPDLCWLMATLLLIIPANWILGWMFAVLLHEFGHYIALEFCKAPVSRIRFGFRGALMEARELTDTELLLCSSAGPIIGLFGTLCIKYFATFSICSFALSIYNLIPLPGHDGDKMLYAACQMLFPEKTSNRIKKGIQITILIAVAGAVIYLLFV